MLLCLILFCVSCSLAPVLGGQNDEQREILKKIFNTHEGSSSLEPSETLELMNTFAKLTTETADTFEEEEKRASLVKKMVDLCQPKELRCKSREEFEIYEREMELYLNNLTQSDSFGDKTDESNAFVCLTKCQLDQEQLCRDKFMEKLENIMQVIEEVDLDKINLFRAILLSHGDFNTTLDDISSPGNELKLALTNLDFMDSQAFFPKPSKLGTGWIKTTRGKNLFDVGYTNLVLRLCIVVNERLSPLEVEFRNLNSFIEIPEANTWMDLQEHCELVLRNREKYQDATYVAATERHCLNLGSFKYLF